MASHAALAIARGATAWLTGSLGLAAMALEGIVGGSAHVVALIGIQLSTRAPDPRHPYGYERYEAVASLLIGMFMLATVGFLVWGAAGRLIEPERVTVPALALSVAGIAGLTNVGMSRYLARRANALQSRTLLAQSSHAWADAAVDASVIAAILMSGIGLTRADPMIGLLVASIIAWRVWQIVRGASDVLTDAAAADPEQIRRAALAVPGVLDCHAIRCRGEFGHVRVDLHIHVPPDLDIVRAHDLAAAVEGNVKATLDGVAEVLVHVGAVREPTGGYTVLGDGESTSDEPRP